MASDFELKFKKCYELSDGQVTHVWSPGPCTRTPNYLYWRTNSLPYWDLLPIRYRFESLLKSIAHKNQQDNSYLTTNEIEKIAISVVQTKELSSWKATKVRIAVTMWIDTKKSFENLFPLTPLLVRFPKTVLLELISNKVDPPFFHHNPHSLLQRTLKKNENCSLCRS